MFPLSSRSTQLLSQTVLAGGSASNGRGEYTTLLQQGLGDDDDGGVDLRFRLCSGGGGEPSRTFIIGADPSPRGVQQSGSRHTEQSTLRGGASVTGGVRPSASGRQHGSSAPTADRLTSTCPARHGAVVGSLRIGGTLHSTFKTTTPAQPDLKDDGTCRPAVRPAPSVENITRGVSNMRAHNNGGDDDGGGGDDVDERSGEDMKAGDDDDDIPIRLLGKTGGRGRGRSRGAVHRRSVGRGGRGGVSDDGGKSATYWSPEEQMQLVRCKREQEMHLAGLGHNYGRMRTKEWKWDDIAKRMANAGRPKDAEDCMKKWENIFQNYKKVQSGGQISCVAGVSIVVMSSSRGGQIFCLPRARRCLLPADYRSPASRGCPSSSRLLPTEGRSSLYHAQVVVVTPQPHGRHFSRETYFQEIYFLPRRPHFPLIRSHRQARLQRSPRNMSTRGNTRGKKRDVVVDDSQGHGRGRRQAPKVKRLHTEDVSVGVPRRGAQGWAAAAEGDYDDEFTTEEEQAEATTSEVRKSGRQRSSDHTASKRMMTPPPEAQQLRGSETRTEKALVVDLGGDDDEPLERRRIRIHTAATPPSEVAVLVAAKERPVSGRLPATPCQPHQHNEGGNGGFVQRGSGGEVVADARAVGAEEGGAAGAGGSCTVAAVAMAREEVAVGATTREEARGKKKGDREAGERGSSRVHRSSMTKDLIDRAVFWVDDKAFWTMGEGRRLYNIVRDTREYFVTIASCLLTPVVPRSVRNPARV
ncbi:hypothetical protein CBR_g27988 [Chara braunii]|uniref:Myb-like domain-containing protein n=1 Tax=Chara braunii TaxID=69332 RepID=A0A388L900_CHABU|nr:hypothetical protein CBR_g27988 [Chara braunii]|eukprot:GBG78764.1 hypothetical protein CBR_g27988 [Chara braunii]